LLGILLSVSGAVIVIVLSDNSESAERIILGNICLIVNCLSFAIYAIIQKGILSNFFLNKKKHLKSFYFKYR